MAGPKTSAEKAREDAENTAADDMFGGAFGGLEEMEVPETTPASDASTEEESGEQAESPSTCLLYTSPSPRDKRQSRMPSSA